MNSEFIHTIKKAPLGKRYMGKRPFFRDNPATHSFRTSILTIMACIELKEKYKMDVNMEKAVLSAIFHDLCDAETGGFRYDTKQALKKTIKRGEHRTNLEIVGKLSPSLQPYFYQVIVNAEDDSFEGRLLSAIDNFDAMLFTYRESTEGRRSKFFIKEHQKLLNEMRNHELEIIRYFTEEFEKEEGFYEFLMLLLEVDDEDRWATSYNFFSDSVAEHSWRGAAIGAFFSVYENVKKKNNFKIDVLRVVAAFLFHDFPEAVVGDPNGPFKHADEETKNDFHQYEDQKAQEIIDLLPSYYRPYLEEYMVNAKDNTKYEGELIGVVDKVDALMKSHSERTIHPFEYEKKYRTQLLNIQMNYGNYPCVEYFLEFILHDLDNPYLNK